VKEKGPGPLGAVTPKTKKNIHVMRGKIFVSEQLQIWQMCEYLTSYATRPFVWTLYFNNKLIKHLTEYNDKAA
jgi:hypothetical protein